MPLAVALLEEGFDAIKERGADVVDIFYAHLLAMDPKLARRFVRTDMAAQKKKLVGVLLLLRRSLRDLSPIIPALESLGARHAELHIQPHEFLAVGYALVTAMGEIGGAGWVERYGGPWTAAYLLVYEVMQGGGGAMTRLREESERQLRERAARLQSELLAQKTRGYLAHLKGCRARRSLTNWSPNGACTCGMVDIRAELTA